jgi:hypothetical protein
VCVTREQEERLVEQVLEHKKLVVICGDGFHVLVIDGVREQVVVENTLHQKVVVDGVQMVQIHVQHLRPQFGPQADDAALLGELARQHQIVHFDHFLADLETLLLDYTVQRLVETTLEIVD